MKPGSNIRVGTSGYSFEDWRGNFYPAKIEKGKMLDHYVNHFKTVEINSTYYRIPHPAVMANIAAKCPAGFDMIVKVPQSFTHRRDEIESDAAAFSDCLSPLIESDLLSGVLAQFPYSFKFSEKNLGYIARCRDAVKGQPLFVEFRHNSWVNRQMYDRLKAEEIGYVSVDEPDLSGLLKPDVFATTDIGYLGLHGRNSEQWWNGGALRYDYKYSDEELAQFSEKVKKLMNKVKRAYVFFNNCHEGQAAENALQFGRMIGS